jgi:Iron-containing redox enzyme
MTSSVMEAVGVPETVKEREFGFDNPDVGKHTDMFMELQREARLFDAFDELKMPLRGIAVVLGAFWYRFSTFMPQFASMAAGMLRNNQMRHFAIQTPFEELGGRDGDSIHADLFADTLRAAGIDGVEFLRWCSFRPLTEALANLEKALGEATSDAEILGMLHGMEIPAEEIMVRLFNGLAHTEEVREALDRMPFFMIHRQIEVEHIRRGTANFLRFCPDMGSRMAFMRGFDQALNFWQCFWYAVAQAVRMPHRVTA